MKRVFFFNRETCNRKQMIICGCHKVYLTPCDSLLGALTDRINYPLKINNKESMLLGDLAETDKGLEGLWRKSVYNCALQILL